jgi:hypothetical protein
MRRKKTMSDYDNPNLLLQWEREFIRTSIRFYVDRMRDFLERNPDIKDTNIERWEARQEHVMEKLKQFQDLDEPKEEDDEELVDAQMSNIKGDNDE